MRIQPKNGIHVRSAFLSDIHLGARECRAELVLDFLHSVQADHLFLVGDIIDIWSMRRSFHWPQTHNNVLRTILGKAKHGTRVIYVPGNHDELLRDLCGHQFGNLEVHRQYVHTTARGLQMLVMHGDEFDSAVKCHRWLAALGSHMYDVALGLNRYVNATRRVLGYPYWSLASPQSAILSAVIFNALIIIVLIPLALKGVKYRAVGAAALLRRNLAIYGVGGLLLPFIGIKVIETGCLVLQRR